MAVTNKVNLPVAVNSFSKLDVSSTHITTGSFMQFRPFYYRHVIPGEHIKGSVNVLSRLAPLQVPTYGRCRINTRAWFVPFRLVFPNFDSFINDTIANNYSYSSLVASSPIFPNSALVEMFINGAYFGHNLAEVISGWNTGDPYDFAVGSSPIVHYRLTYYGLAFMTILNSLGYRMCLGDTKSHDFDYSALGLLCLARVYADWYTNDQYKNSADYLSLMRLFKYNDPTSNLVLTYLDLNNILSFFLLVIYDGGKDVFVNAWDNPVAPNSGNFSSVSGNDVSLLGLGFDPNQATVNVQSGTNGTPIMYQTSATSTIIGTDYTHQFLKAATDFMKRNQLSGAAECDRFLSRFGINLDSSKLDRSVFVSEKSIDVDFGSVMSQADTSASGDPSNLGDYAGVGLGRGNMEFDYKCNDFGLFIMTYSIIPAASLYQGFDRNNLHINKMDFFMPEFDQLGCSAISCGEVYVSPNDGYANPDDYKKIWGFAPRLYEYKQKQDFVTGQFVSPTAFAGGDAWHLNRELNDTTFGGTVANQVHSISFTRGVDAGIYDRIFQYTNSDTDKFYLVFHVAAETLAPCKSLVDTYDFESNGKHITLHSNGAKVN